MRFVQAHCHVHIAALRARSHAFSCRCVIYYYLDDGSLYIAEPKTTNSGMPQGVLLKKHKARPALLYSPPGRSFPTTAGRRVASPVQAPSALCPSRPPLCRSRLRCPRPAARSSRGRTSPWARSSPSTAAPTTSTGPTPSPASSTPSAASRRARGAELRLPAALLARGALATRRGGPPPRHAAPRDRTARRR